MKLSVRIIALVIVVGLVASGGLLFLGALNSEQPGGPGPSDEPSPSKPSDAAATPAPPATETGPTSMLYLQRRTLRRVELGSGRISVVGRMPTSDVFASPTSSWLAYVVGTTPAGEAEPDALGDPAVRIIDISSGEDRHLGSGFSPVWNPEGTSLAYLRPTGAASCEGDDCRVSSEIVAYDPEDDVERVVAEPSPYTLLGWAGDSILASDLRDLSATFAFGRSGRERVPVTPSELWGASPEGSLYVRSRPGRADVVGPGGRSVQRLDVGDGILAEGSWSPAGDSIAAVLVGRRSSVRLFDVSSGGGMELRGRSDGAGSVTWSPDGSTVGFVEFSARSPGARLVTCSAASSDEACDPPIELGPRVSLLRFEDDAGS